MKTKAVRIHGASDLRLDEFELPPLGADEIRASVVSDSLCMSSNKLAKQGEKHKRVRGSLRDGPIIIGHEFCGVIEEVGAKWAHQFAPGQRFAIQPALNYQGSLWAPGYSFAYIGGDATDIIIPNEVMEMGCLLVYEGDNFFGGSLAEPVSCIVGAFHAQYHTRGGSYVHEMGIKEGGTLALLGGVGPMGMCAIDYAVHAERKPARVVVTDIDSARIARAASIFTPQQAQAQGVDLVYANTKEVADPVAHLVALNGGSLFDDVFVFAPVQSIVELGDKLLGHDGCLNFFAGPTDTSFSALVNMYGVHYEAHHYVGTSGGNTDDIVESLTMMAAGKLNPVAMITHVGGLNAVPATTLELDKIPGGKKLIYTQKKLDLVALADFEARGKTEPFYAELARIISAHNMLWCKEAEDYLLANAPTI
jgi:threonine dehydrogenase-like Zn-dependent dehydrogenase